MSTINNQLKKYLIGFSISLVITLLAFIMVMNNQISGKGVYIFIGILAAIQLVVQLMFFLHIGQSKGPKWDSLAFYYTVFAIATLVIGSIWIMSNLHYNMDMNTTKNYEQKTIKDEIPNTNNSSTDENHSSHHIN